jgi:phosphate transport system permease protein
MSSTTKPYRLLRYFKSKKRESLVAAVLIIIAIIILTSFAISKAVDLVRNNPNDTSAVTGWVSDFDNYTTTISTATVFLLPNLVLLVIAYLLLEAHPMGWKASYAFAVIATGLAITGFEANTIIPIAILTALAATISLNNQRNNPKTNYAIITENVAKVGLGFSGLTCLFIFLGMIIYSGVRGSPFLNLNFITGSWNVLHAAQVLGGAASGDVGGISIYIIGTLMIVAVCEAIAVPLGICSAIYLSEYAPQNKFTEAIRFFIETLAGVPSVMIGIVSYSFLCNYLGWSMSLLAAGIALMIMILPWNIRVSEEALRAVPASYREGAYALGSTQSQAIGKIVLYAASPGVVTGIILGIGAAIGETAVVLLTASNAPFPYSVPSSLTGQPVPALTVWIDNAWSQVDGFGRQLGTKLGDAYNLSFAGAFVLISIFIVICLAGLVIRNYLNKKITGQ